MWICMLLKAEVKSINRALDVVKTWCTKDNELCIEKTGLFHFLPPKKKRAQKSLISLTMAQSRYVPTVWQWASMCGSHSHVGHINKEWTVYTPHSDLLLNSYTDVCSCVVAIIIFLVNVWLKWVMLTQTLWAPGVCDSGGPAVCSHVVLVCLCSCISRARKSESEAIHFQLMQHLEVPLCVQVCDTCIYTRTPKLKQLNESQPSFMSFLF